jgi:hypothetical protein
VVSLYCDTKGCHRSATVMADTPKQARRYARQMGWRYDKQRKKDICPEHVRGQP